MLTLVIPCYREAERLSPAPYLAFIDRSRQTRLLFVDDGSPDDTPHLLAAMAAQRPGRIGVLTLPANMGKGEAVRRGMLEAMGAGADQVGFWDADLATPLEQSEEFQAVLTTHPEVSWVLGSRWRALGRAIIRNPIRHYLGRAFATAASLALGLAVYDTQCGAKVFRADNRLRRILEEPFVSRWIFDVEMLARLVREHRLGTSPDPEQLVFELPLSAWRHDGRSHVRPGDFFAAALDLGRIWWRFLR